MFLSPSFRRILREPEKGTSGAGSYRLQNCGDKGGFAVIPKIHPALLMATDDRFFSVPLIQGQTASPFKRFSS